MPLRIIGEHPLAQNVQGLLKSRIGTVFPRRRVLVTLPGIHAWQRLALVEYLNLQRPVALTPEEEAAEFDGSVDLILEPDSILIRPDPDNMALAFEADEILQELVSKQRIHFLSANNERVQQAIKERGECWRISPLPRSLPEMNGMIAAAKTAIGGEAIYYYNRFTGARYLTYQEFARMGSWERPLLAKHLDEITVWSGRTNRLGHPEIDFFLAKGAVTARDFRTIDWLQATPERLTAAYEELKSRFQQAVPPDLQADDPQQTEWRNRMVGALINETSETVAEELLRGISPEFFLQIQWLPGGRMEEGELIFDPIFEELELNPPELTGAALVDQKVKGFIFNLIREYGDLEYVNIGRVASTLSHRPPSRGRREVFIAELKPREAAHRVVRILRMQKWGIREHLDENMDLLSAIIESEEYTEYVLDRRLGCRQLGMNLPPRSAIGKVSEKYPGSRGEYVGRIIWATYFERDYVVGAATDKIASAKFSHPEYTRRFARLLGEAAAPNLIVCRIDLDKKALFDDGDETVMEDAEGMPREIIITDHTGAFGDFLSDLDGFAKPYAEPVLRRVAFVPNPAEFAQAYLEAFVERFLAIQADYRKRRRAFDTLFKHRKRDERGSFAYRWERVLARLDSTDARALGEGIGALLPIKPAAQLAGQAPPATSPSG